jgi:transcriptional regulator with XRE-family HTH domain
MVQACSGVRQKSEYSRTLAEHTIAPMAKKRGDEPPITDRTRRLLRQLEAARLRRGLSKGEVARRIGALPPTVSNILNEKEGVGIDRALAFIDALGLAIRDSTEDEPISVGSVGADAVLLVDVPHITFPCTALVRVAFGHYQPGDTIYLKAATTLELGRWLLLEKGDGRVFAKAGERGNDRVLLMGNGDTVLYEPARHKVIGCIYRYLRTE